MCNSILIQKVRRPISADKVCEFHLIASNQYGDAIYKNINRGPKEPYFLLKMFGGAEIIVENKDLLIAKKLCKTRRYSTKKLYWEVKKELL